MVPHHREVRSLALDQAGLRVEACPESRSADGRIIRGYAAVFNTWSQDLGGFREIIRPGAFARGLEAGDDVVALYNHDRAALLGRRSAGTLRLREDPRGLAVEIEPPDTTLGRDVVELIRRGDLRGMSFAFTVADDEAAQRWAPAPSHMTRELRAVILHDVTIATDPAYRDTTVALRCLDAARPAAPDRDAPGPFPLSLAEAELSLARLLRRTDRTRGGSA
jgi:HK97 family phage prohead protease